MVFGFWFLVSDGLVSFWFLVSDDLVGFSFLVLVSVLGFGFPDSWFSSSVSVFGFWFLVPGLRVEQFSFSFFCFWLLSGVLD